MVWIHMGSDLNLNCLKRLSADNGYQQTIKVTTSKERVMILS